MTDVVITGIGVVSPIGIGVDAFWDALVAGASGAGPITRFDAADHPVRIAAEVTDFEPTRYVDARAVARTDRFCQMAVAAASLAWEDAGLEGAVDHERSAVIVGTGIGGL